MILCCGEALIDLIPDAEGSETRTPFVGGAVLNTAVALGRLGVDVSLLTGLSSDSYGAQIEAVLRESHVDPGLAVRSDRPTTLAIVTLKDGQASYVFRDEGSATRMIGPDDLPGDDREFDALVFGGISLINAPVADTFADFCVARAARSVILLDVNIRPGFIDDPDTYRARIDRMIVATDILKVSDDDLDWLLPGLSEAEALAQLAARGPALVVLTKGSQGAAGRLASGDLVEVPAPPARVVDTVGAGDTFNAGFLAALDKGGELTKPAMRTLAPDAAIAALTFAARVAAVTVSRPGPNPPWAHELNGELADAPAGENPS
ncbi:MAG: carbohydrate kinase family protein [Marinibacterium sp.]